MIDVNSVQKKFRVKSGSGRNQKEVELATDEKTSFVKGEDVSIFEQVVVVGDKLDLEVVNGVAVKVTAKK